MLKEGWGRAQCDNHRGSYASIQPKSNILPEKTLGRGLRRMYPTKTPPNMSVWSEQMPSWNLWIHQDRRRGTGTQPMGAGTQPTRPIIIEVDNENVKKDVDKLDMEVPVLTP